MFPTSSQTIPYTELPDLKPDDQLFHEWNTYRKELPRLLAEGHEGKIILLKGTEIIGLYDSMDAAHIAGLKRFLLQPFMLHQILSREPLLRIRR
jgi:hypothetical protein